MIILLSMKHAHPHDTTRKWLLVFLTVIVKFLAHTYNYLPSLSDIVTLTLCGLNSIIDAEPGGRLITPKNTSSPSTKSSSIIGTMTDIRRSPGAKVKSRTVSLKF